MSVRDKALALRELLDKPEHWTQWADARLSNGNPTAADNSKATQWCLRGGTWKVCGERTQEWYELLMAIEHALRETESFTRPLIRNWEYWNDHKDRTHADVIELLDRVVASLSQSC